MSDLEFIDATKLFEYVKKGIVSEDFGEARAWIRDNIEPRFIGNSEQIVGVKNSANPIYYWEKKDVDDFKSVLDKLEELYKKQNKP
jgi:hypothetical protein